MKSQYNFGIFIVALVAFTIVSSAGRIVYAVVSEKHSAPILVASEVQQLSQKWSDYNEPPVPEESNNEMLALLTESPEVLGVSTESCNVDFETYASNNSISIVNYLKKRNEPYSFEARMKLAEELGIVEYRGTAEQNTELLKKLLEKNQEIEKNC
jgi:hypothetical protein